MAMEIRHVKSSAASNPGSFVKDFSASLVVFLVALPLCMGIALASGMPPAAGLVTGVIGGVVVGALSGQPLQASGPAAGLAVIVFELVRQHGVAGLGPILILAGAMQLIAGLLKAGRWFRAISPEVIHGMLAGIGVLIVIQQFHVVLDRSPEHSGPANIVAMWSAVFGVAASRWQQRRSRSFGGTHNPRSDDLVGAPPPGKASAGSECSSGHRCRNCCRAGIPSTGSSGECSGQSWGDDQLSQAERDRGLCLDATYGNSVRIGFYCKCGDIALSCGSGPNAIASEDRL
jgi:hypothetical protein